MTPPRTLKDYRPQHDLTCPAGSVKSECPVCGGLLDRVRQSANSMLNEYQFDAVKAGDYYCSACKGEEAQGSTYKYWWARELGVHACSCGLDDLLSVAECPVRRSEEEKNDQGGHVPHGGRSDLGPAAPDAASHAGSGGWLPIESAPKDGRAILGTHHYAGALMWVAAIAWRIDDSYWWSEGPALGTHDADTVYGGPVGDTWPVTHWMPLPVPPVLNIPLRGQLGSASLVAGDASPDTAQEQSEEINRSTDQSPERPPQEETIQKCENCGTPLEAVFTTADDVDLCHACYLEVPRDFFRDPHQQVGLEQQQQEIKEVGVPALAPLLAKFMGSYNQERTRADAAAEERDRAYTLFPPLLQGVCDALKGVPEPAALISHDWSDLPKVAAAWRKRAEVAEATIAAVKALAAKGYRHWDTDEDSKAGKVLSALAGVPGCYPEIDALYTQVGSHGKSLLSEASGSAQSAAPSSSFSSSSSQPHEQEKT